MRHQEPAIGLWFAPCCEQDVQQIETEADLTELLELMENFRENDGVDRGDEWISFKYFDSRDELMREITGDSEK